MVAFELLKQGISETIHEVPTAEVEPVVDEIKQVCFGYYQRNRTSSVRTERINLSQFWNSSR